MSRPHAAALIEDALNLRVLAVLSERGWSHKIIAYTGYGTTRFVRVLGRIVMTRHPRVPAAADAEATPRELRSADDEARGWKAFITAPAMNVPVQVVIGDHVVDATTDRSGLIDVTVPDPGMPAGWQRVGIRSPQAMETEATVRIIGDDQSFGIISDIDDTVLTTMLPRPLVAFWNTFVRSEHERRAVPGMATMYRELLEENPGAPIIYVSTGAWNTAPHLTRFLRRNGFPMGPLLLTDWGPTNSGWFRSGAEHKRSALARLARELPHITWLLVGDDGQRDPTIYGEFAQRRPNRVAAIALRELSLTEQVVTHGGPTVPDTGPAGAGGGSMVPVCRAPDGYQLGRLVRLVLAGSRQPSE